MEKKTGPENCHPNIAIENRLYIFMNMLARKKKATVVEEARKSMKCKKALNRNFLHRNLYVKLK